MSLNMFAMDNFYAEIGARMKTVRKLLRLTQAQVAEKAGIDTSFYGQIERGVNIPSLKTFVAISVVLKVEPSELLGVKSGGGEQLYETTIRNLMKGLNQKNKARVLGLIRDIVAGYADK